MTNYLAKNIRHLRKLNNWSQEELARRLQIKRSSVAAYESKNVHPRLDLIIAIARLFKVGFSDLIEKDLTGSRGVSEGTGIRREDAEVLIQLIEKQHLNAKEGEALKGLIDKSMGIRKMLEGFKAFYRLKLENMSELSEDARRLAGDIENFLLLIDHLLTYQEEIIRVLSGERQDG